jgi:GxxExxY protein
MYHPELNQKIKNCVRTVYNQLGPGLPDEIYKECMIHEFKEDKIDYLEEAWFPIDYKGHILEAGLYASFIIDMKIVIYVKSAEKNLDYYKMQLDSYMGFSGIRCGMIIDFNEPDMRQMIRVFLEENGD